MANTQPVFELTPVDWIVQVSAANSALNGTGTISDLGTGGTSGTRIDAIRVHAATVTTAGMVRIFVKSGGTSYLVKELPVSAVTPSATQDAFEREWVRNDGLPVVLLSSGQILQVTTEKAETFNVQAIGGDY